MVLTRFDRRARVRVRSVAEKPRETDLRSFDPENPQ
jgi:hypothetical protein